MKRLLTFFTLLLLAFSCAKEADVSQVTLSGEAPSITASVKDMTGSRATLINSWSGGEQVALFISGHDNAYLLTLAEDGTMSGDDIIIDRKAELTYTSFYPYDEALTTIEEYEAACKTGHVDYMSATTTTTGAAVELQFSHLLAALSFTVVVDGIALDPAISLALDGNLSNTVALEVDYSTSIVNADYFVTAGSDISSAVIKVEQSGFTTFHSIAQKDSNIVEAGKQYTYSCSTDLALSLGTGTNDDPYVIYLADLMRKVGTGIDGWYLSSHYKLWCDIDLESVEFTPIGSSDEMFTGSFDGNGYSITGLQITGSEAGQGLFKYTSGATIKNLKVGGTVTNSSGETAGLIIGYAKNNTTITGCETLSGSIVTNSGGNNAAGIVAHITYGATVTNCINRATINGNKYSSGIVGYCSDATTTITNCTNEGAITNTSSADYTGGILARTFSSHKIADCSNSGKISGATYTGGIVGSNEGGASVSNCYNTGSVTGSAKYNGGVIGYSDKGCTVSYCHNTGSVTGSNTFTGGVIGFDKSTTYNCYNTGSVKGTSNVGGVTGCSYLVSLNCCYNTGSVSGSYYIGGVNGVNSDNNMTNCYNTGSVKATDSYGRVGGVSGENNAGTISYCYNTGLVSGSSSSPYVGGVSGVISYSGTISYCYYDETVLDSIGAVERSDGAITTYYGLTTAEMKGDASTEGTLLYHFSDSTNWTADDATNPINGGYPILTWQISNN